MKKVKTAEVKNSCCGNGARLKFLPTYTKKLNVKAEAKKVG